MMISPKGSDLTPTHLALGLFAASDVPDDDIGE